MKKTIKEMEAALIKVDFFIGGLPDEGIRHYYQKMRDAGKIK